MMSLATARIRNQIFLPVLVTFIVISSSTVRADDTQQGGKGWFLAALIPSIGNVLIDSLARGSGCVFSNLLDKLGIGGAAPNPNCKNNATAVNNAPVNTLFTPQAAAVVSTQPVLSFVVQKLSDNTLNARVIETISSSPLQQGSDPSFTIHTGESFAIAFSTSVPGRVRLINTDVDNQVSLSSLYEAIPASDNRMPRQHEGGILMTGKTGTEILEVEFVPCVSQSLRQHPSVAPFVNSLAACTNEAATKEYRPALPSGKGGVAEFGGKSMGFPPGGDPNQPVAIAPANYTKGEMLRFRINVNHLPPTSESVPADPRA